MAGPPQKKEKSWLNKIDVCLILQVILPFYRNLLGCRRPLQLGCPRTEAYIISISYETWARGKSNVQASDKLTPASGLLPSHLGLEMVGFSLSPSVPRLHL